MRSASTSMRSGSRVGSLRSAAGSSSDSGGRCSARLASSMCATCAWRRSRRVGDQSSARSLATAHVPSRSRSSMRATCSRSGKRPARPSSNTSPPLACATTRSTMRRPGSVLAIATTSAATRIGTAAIPAKAQTQTRAARRIRKPVPGRCRAGTNRCRAPRSVARRNPHATAQSPCSSARRGPRPIQSRPAARLSRPHALRR